MCNGWTNHATWAIYTELSNSESAYLRWTSNAKRCPNVGLLAAHMRAELEFSNRRAVNWDELAKAFWEDTTHEMRLM